MGQKKFKVPPQIEEPKDLCHGNPRTMSVNTPAESGKEMY